MWYVIQVTTGREMDIAGELKKQGIRALVPRENRMIRNGGRWVWKEYTLFGGYVFLDMEYNAENYYKVRKLPGVARFLGDGEPSTLSYLEAEWIMALTGRDNAPISPTIVSEAPDGSLKVVSGILRRFENRVTRYDKRNRKAVFEITVCGEKKEVQLGIALEDDGEKAATAGEDAPAEAAQEVLEEAT